ncbi:MAG TPA: cytosine permease, partial [Bacteroidia bacterium]|nr:cytosine permease [Bacteroidia bacterium]
IFPWKLIADPNGYIFTWLIAYSSLLGPVGGIMIADYFYIKKQKLVVQELYETRARYTFNNGFNRAAIAALLLGIIPNIPGFLVAIHVIPTEHVYTWISGLYNYAWFVGFGVSFFTYLFLSRRLN